MEWKSREDKTGKFYRGEWIVFDCQLKNHFTNVSLWQQDIAGNFKERVADGKKIIKFANQKFNLTSLTDSDKGDYECRACDQKSDKGELDVSQYGKYIHVYAKDF